MDQLEKRFGFRCEFDGTGLLSVYIKHRITGHIINQIINKGFKFIDVFREPANSDELRVNFMRCK